MLHERRALQLWLAADEVPDYALYTATWALIAPQLADLFPGAHWHNATCACELLWGVKNCLMYSHAHAEASHVLQGGKEDGKRVPRFQAVRC